ncbi:30S ribosomal protein S3 [Tichowtungia aerotolerans]|uniref:Small ribosomal subunit protein uS3 n=1 Tax=Tichowtungia aerotolerans TaxID=2697043 RepID=A0A6P1M0C6_9BACT|nr:30S ribosomal protein S3 [Tichowtungia aerotolerans]QHI68249.1 30S ribosomal protein S3 [Tichowtungia aerotolerans]
MGQKVNPIGLRVAVNKNWRSRWFAGKKEFSDLLLEDTRIREVVQTRLKDAALSNVFIERYANRVRVTVRTARPGLVIGRKGEDIERLREQLGRLTKKEVYIEIDEVKTPDLDAKLVAENIALQLERRVSFRRAMKRAIQMAMDTGAEGIKVMASGRLGGAELSRSESYKEGKIPLHTLRADIDYGTATARTVAGAIGIKVWICKKDEKAEV